MTRRSFARWAAPLQISPSFRLLFLATLGSGLGTMLAVIALAVDVYERTGSGAWVSALLVADFVPTILIGLLLAPLVDRFSRRRLMITSDLVRLAAFLALPFAGSPGVIVALALVIGFANGFFNPAAYAAVPNLVRDEQLPRANAILQTTTNLTWMLGPPAGGVLLAVWGPSVPYLVNAATFLVSALLIVRIPERLLRSEEPLSRGHWRDLAEGFALVRRSSALLTVLIAWTMVMLADAAINVSEVFFVRESLDSGNLGLGLMLGGAGLGLVIGSALAGPLLERAAVAPIYGGSIAVMALGFGAAALSPSIVMALPMVVVAGIGNGAASVCNPLLVQRGAPDRLRGRAFSVVMSVNFVFLGAGMAVAGPATDAVGARALWGCAAVILLAAALVGAALARGVRAVPDGEELEPVLVGAGTPQAVRPGESAI